MSNADLIARLEALTWPDRELDAEIYNALVEDGGRIAFRVENWSRLPGSRLDRYHDGWLVGKSKDDQYSDDLRRYTASLDAAFALTERLLPGWRWTLFGPHPDILTVNLVHAELWRRVPHVAVTEPISGRSTTPAIALLIATLKAHDNLKEANHG